MKKTLGLILKSLFDVFRFHKKKVAFFLASTLFWFLLCFPYDNLSDYVTLKISQGTQGRVYIQFDKISLGWVSGLGVKMDNVLLESAYAPALSFKRLSLSPHLSTLFGALGGDLRAEGFFKGEARVGLASSSELEGAGDEMGIHLSLEQVALKEVFEFVKKIQPLPFSIRGKGSLQSELHLDRAFEAQPKGHIHLELKGIDTPSSNLPLGSGLAMPVPGLKLSQVELKGEFEEGRFRIKEGRIGNGVKGDGLHGQVTGDLFFEVVRGGRLKMGGYDLQVNLNIKEDLKRQLGTILSFVDIYQNIGTKHKFESLGSVRYSMGLRARSMESPPRISPYQPPKP